MSLTGPQIREARKLLRWGRVHLSRAAALPLNLITTIESSEGVAWLTEGQETAIRRAFEDAGIEFGPDSVRLRTSEP